MINVDDIKTGPEMVQARTFTHPRWGDGKSGEYHAAQVWWFPLSVCCRGTPLTKHFVICSSQGWLLLSPHTCWTDHFLPLSTHGLLTVESSCPQHVQFITPSLVNIPRVADQAKFSLCTKMFDPHQHICHWNVSSVWCGKRKNTSDPNLLNCG